MTEITDDLGTPITEPKEPDRTEPRELNVFDMNYGETGFDFRPNPIAASPAGEEAPKALSAAESASSSAELGEESLLEAPMVSPPLHPSQLDSLEESASAEKASGTTEVPDDSLKQTSSTSPNPGPALPPVAIPTPPSSSQK